MLRKFFSLLLTCSFLLPQFFVQQTYAQQTSNSNDSEVTIADAVYADLALRGYLDNVSIDYNDGNPVHTITINETRHWLPASTVKTFAAMYAYYLIAKGKLHLYDQVTIEAKNVVPNELVTDELPTILEGDSLTIDRLIKQMITQSDNTAFNVLLDSLNREEVTKYIKTIGLAHSAVGSKLNLDTSQEQYEFDQPGYGINTTTAEDYAKAFLLIKQNKIPGAKDLFAILKQQKINNMIPLLLPKNIVIGHKTGDLDPLYHDGGIIVGPDSTYVLTVFTNVGDPNVIAHLSQLIYTKNYDLVGSAIQGKTLSDANATNHYVDPLVSNFPANKEVLGAQTTEPQMPPSITAADLGITANDLSLTIQNNKLPTVLIPADSPFHLLVPAGEFLKKAFVLGSKARTQTDLDTLSLRIAEAKNEKEKGNQQLANAILRDVQGKLNTVVKDKFVTSDPKSQTLVQSVSETRFKILGDELKAANQDQRKQIIKDIATQAKDTLSKVQPFIPEAIDATNPSQKPLVGEITKTTDTTVTVKTAGGQQIIIPTTNEDLKIRSKNSSASTAASLADVPIGTTIAVIGSSVGNIFNPSFVLTNLPKELSAPQPVTVLKVDSKKETLIVSENGVPIQVNITSKTNIKGSDTNLSLTSIKPGDVVVVHGEPINMSTASAQPATNAASPTPTQKTEPSGVHTSIIPSIILSVSPTAFPTASLSKKPTSSITQSIQKPAVNSEQKSNATPPTNTQPTTLQKTTAPVVTQQQTEKSTQITNQTPQPKVIQSTTIQVVEQKKDVQPPSPQKPSNSQQQSQQQVQQPQTHNNPPTSAPISIPKK